MKRIAVIVILINLSSASVLAQVSELSIFDNLIDKVWVANGQWGDGSKFKQEITFSHNLEKTIVTANTLGFVNKEQTKIGERNFGIRKYDIETKSVKFWEFDVFGGITTGSVFAEGKNIIYQYKYGDSVITDMWEYVNENTYNFKVGNYENGKWKEIYLSTKFIEQIK